MYYTTNEFDALGSFNTIKTLHNGIESHLCIVCSCLIYHGLALQTVVYKATTHDGIKRLFLIYTTEKKKIIIVSKVYLNRAIQDQGVLS